MEHLAQLPGSASNRKAATRARTRTGRRGRRPAGVRSRGRGPGRTGKRGHRLDRRPALQGRSNGCSVLQRLLHRTRTAKKPRSAESLRQRTTTASSRRRPTAASRRVSRDELRRRDRLRVELQQQQFLERRAWLRRDRVRVGREQLGGRPRLRLRGRGYLEPPDSLLAFLEQSDQDIIDLFADVPHNAENLRGSRLPRRRRPTTPTTPSLRSSVTYQLSGFKLKFGLEGSDRGRNLSFQAGVRDGRRRPRGERRCALPVQRRRSSA